MSASGVPGCHDGQGLLAVLGPVRPVAVGLPISQDDDLAISIAYRRYEEFRALEAEAADLRQALKDRKVIEKAKDLLMLEASIDEETAFRRLQKLASARNRKLVEIARMIVETAEAFRRPPEG